MISTNELLIVAAELAVGATDAHWRRSISTAYYAVFQMFLSDVGELIDCGQHVKQRLPRIVEHKTFYSIAIALSPEPKNDAKLKLLFRDGVIPVDATGLREMAALIRGLFEARQNADYNPGWQTDSKNALVKLQNAKRTIELWSELRRTQAGRVFLTALLLGDKLKDR